MTPRARKPHGPHAARRTRQAGALALFGATLIAMVLVTRGGGTIASMRSPIWQGVAAVGVVVRVSAPEEVPSALAAELESALNTQLSVFLGEILGDSHALDILTPVDARLLEPDRVTLLIDVNIAAVNRPFNGYVLSLHSNRQRLKDDMPAPMLFAPPPEALLLSTTETHVTGLTMRDAVIPIVQRQLRALLH